MFKMRMKKIITYMMLFAMTVCLLSGCEVSSRRTRSKISKDGRSYGGIISAKMGEDVETAFFTIQVKSANCLSRYQFGDGIYEAEEGKTYLAVEMVLTNTSGKDIPMSITDFTIDYEGNESDKPIGGYGRADLINNSFMENVFTFKEGETITKSILFAVDKKDSYILRYKEFYEDDFEGDTYEIEVVPTVTSNIEVPTESGTEE